MFSWYWINNKTKYPENLMPKKRTQEEFIEILKEKFGDKIDVSKVKYINNTTPIEIRCTVHDIWCKETPKMLLRYSNFCPECRKEESKKPKNRKCTKNKERRKILCKEDFIKYAKEIHGDFYSYDKADIRYIETKDEYGLTHIKRKSPKKIIITCPIHGDFEQISINHLVGKGCPKCAIKRSQKSNRAFKTKEDLIEAFKKVHGDEYDYSKVGEYTSRTDKVEIICREHGSFWQSPAMHLRGEGCPKCDMKYKACACERRIFHLIKQRFPNLEIISGYRDKSIFGRQHLDIYIPEYKIAVEYQGPQHFQNDEYLDDYRHSLNHRQELDFRKWNLCKENGISIFYFTFNKKFKDIEYFSKVYTNIDELLNEILLKIEKNS